MTVGIDLSESGIAPEWLAELRQDTVDVMEEIVQIGPIGTGPPY